MIASKSIPSKFPRLRIPLSVWIAASFSIAGAAEQTAAQPRIPDPQPPNVVLVLADDMGWNQVGYHGSKFYETPNIDRIAREGIQFRHAYSAAPICSPTRAALM